MIHPGAVKQFLEVRRDSFVWIKGLSVRQLDDALAGLDFKSISPIPLDRHQKSCILLGLAYPRFAFWLDMGCGKTRIILELLSHFWRLGILKRGLILAVSDEALGGWEDEINKWGFKVPYVLVGNSSTAEKWQTVAGLGAGIIITTYPGFNYMFANKIENKKSGKTQMKPNVKKIRTFSQNLDAFVPDESVHLGNHRSLGFKIARKLSQSCRIVYDLAGVPFGRDPTLLWSQMYLIDAGESLGQTLGLFRSAFFTEKPGWFGGFDYTFIKKMEPKLTELMQHRSISYMADECGDLPVVTSIIRNIKLPSGTRDYFERTMEALRHARGNKQQIINLFLRMRQLSSGFIGYTDDETGERAQLVMPHNPKLDDLLNLIEDMPFNRKFVVFYEFTFSGRQIMAGLKKRGIEAGWLWSGTKDGRLLKRRFDDDDPKRMKGLVINWHLGSESLNLQRANYKHYYETPVGVIARKQSQKRCFRTGQTLPGFLYDYVATQTDRRVLQFHADGEDIFKALIRDPYRALLAPQAPLRALLAPLRLS